MYTGSWIFRDSDSDREMRSNRERAERVTCVVSVVAPWLLSGVHAGPSPVWGGEASGALDWARPVCGACPGGPSLFLRLNRLVKGENIRSIN